MKRDGYGSGSATAEDRGSRPSLNGPRGERRPLQSPGPACEVDHHLLGPLLEGGGEVSVNTSQRATWDAGRAGGRDERRRQPGVTAWRRSGAGRDSDRGRTRPPSYGCPSGRGRGNGRDCPTRPGPRAVHPHVRGAHRAVDEAARKAGGPSPRAWGSRAVQRGSGFGPRSIPTCVGLTRRACRGRACGTVHPHVRGAHFGGDEFGAARVGPSPRAWGSPSPSRGDSNVWRSIPTCVGLTVPTRGWRGCRSVHPHVRGAHVAGVVVGATDRGPSPRAWGSQPRHDADELVGRSIPTCVGLTVLRGRVRVTPPVHPHVRGAHSEYTSASSACAGPSPRAWGSPRPEYPTTPPDRSIPTCVGLTPAAATLRRSDAVHPHVRGAHGGAAAPPRHRRGPSPRAWGSLGRVQDPTATERSIPTCVGLTCNPGSRVE